MKPKSITKLIMNGMLCGVLTMGIGTTTAFADDGVIFAPATGSQETAATATTTTVPTAPAAATEQKPELWVTTDEFVELLKTIVQKIEITLTVDDAERAKLLTGITQERIQESDEMLAEGKTEQAAETLQKALDDHNLAIEITVRSEDADDKDQGSEQEGLKEQYRHNIEALTKALEKVKNPTAKAAIARNIAKINAKLSAKPEVQVEAVTAAPAPQTSAEAESVKSEARQEDEDHEDADHEDGDHDKASKELHEKLKNEWKAAHENAKAERKAAHEKAKAERKTGHGKKNGDD